MKLINFDLAYKGYNFLNCMLFNILINESLVTKNMGTINARCKISAQPVPDVY